MNRNQPVTKSNTQLTFKVLLSLEMLRGVSEKSQVDSHMQPWKEIEPAKKH
jgi:hypothetical protein